MLTIFIDESGTLPDPKDKYITICGVGIKKIKEIQNIFSRILNSLRQRKIEKDRFNQILRKGVNKNLKYQIKHTDSQQNFLVNTADMAAGAILWKYSGKDLQFYDIIKENIMIEKIVNWPEIKRKSLGK